MYNYEINKNQILSKNQTNMDKVQNKNQIININNQKQTPKKNNNNYKKNNDELILVYKMILGL